MRSGPTGRQYAEEAAEHFAGLKAFCEHKPRTLDALPLIGSKPLHRRMRRLPGMHLSNAALDADGFLSPELRARPDRLARRGERVSGYLEARRRWCRFVSPAAG